MRVNKNRLNQNDIWKNKSEETDKFLVKDLKSNFYNISFTLQTYTILLSNF